GAVVFWLELCGFARARPIERKDHAANGAPFGSAAVDLWPGPGSADRDATLPSQALTALARGVRSLCAKHRNAPSSSSSSSKIPCKIEDEVKPVRRASYPGSKARAPR